MKAIILAGGMGTRLGKYTENLPKCMLEFSGKTLLERQIETLKKCGISEIIVVKGYMPEKINVRRVKYYVNPNYCETNMVETLFTAEPEINDEFLVCYGDIIYEKDIILKVMEDKSDIGVVVDRDYWEYWSSRMDKPEEDVESLVLNEKKEIVDIGDPNCNVYEAKQRYVGIIKFSKKGARILKEVYHNNKEKYFNKNEPWLRSKSFRKAYMTDMLQAIINEGYKVYPMFISKGWMEFDTVEDYEKANKWLNENTLNRFIKLENT